MLNQRIVVGIASYGMSGRVFHAPLLAHHRGFHIKRIVERSRDEARKAYPGVLIARSLDELLGDDEIDLVVVNTPDLTHYELARRSLEAGKHVIVEKPFTQSIEEGQALLSLARHTGKMLSVYQNRRWDGDFLTVQKIAHERLLGRVVELEARWDRYRAFVQKESWKEQPAAGAGVLYNLGSHLIDQALVLFGMPEAVTAHIRTLRSGGEVDDWFDLRLHYPDVQVSLKASLLVKEPGPRYLLHGTLGSFVKYGLDPQEEALKQGKNPASPGWGGEPEESWGILNIEKDGTATRSRYETVHGNYSLYYDGIYECLVHGKEPPVTPGEALNVVRIVEAARRSEKEGKTLSMSL